MDATAKTFFICCCEWLLQRLGEKSECELPVGIKTYP